VRGLLAYITRKRDLVYFVSSADWPKIGVAGVALDCPARAISPCTSCHLAGSYYTSESDVEFAQFLARLLAFVNLLNS
jgi:hypothetical protein